MRLPYDEPKYSIDDLVKVVQEFYAEHHRVPIYREIRDLSKQGKSPCTTVFCQKGGLNWIIKKAGLHPVKEPRTFSQGEVRREFRKFVLDFKARENRYPTCTECEEKLGIHSSTFRNQTGTTYSDALLGMGASPRRGKEANLPQQGYK